MNRNQIEKLYEINGLDDYILNSTDDILKVHGIDFKAVNGYNRLDDLNRAIYSKFILRFFNVWGLENRVTLVPKGIYLVEDIQYLVKENQEDDYFIISGGVVNAIDRNGMKSVHHSWSDEDYNHLEIKESEATTYLRFEYEINNKKDWLHVIKDGKEWY